MYKKKQNKKVGRINETLSRIIRSYWLRKSNDTP